MTIINHGSWTRYVPENAPAALPSGMSVMFCRRDSDGVDWYDYIYQKGSVFAPGSIKMTVLDGVVQAVVREEDRLFPQSCVVLELTRDDTADPQTKYGQWLYDEATNTLTAPPPPAPVPVIVTPRQARLALLEAGLLDTIETKIRGKNKAFQISWDYATEINRDDPMITTIAKELNLTDAAVDLLFKNAAAK